VKFSGLNLQSKDNDSFLKMIFVTSRNATHAQKEKKQCLQVFNTGSKAGSDHRFCTLQVFNTGSKAGSDHRFCILQIKKLMTQVKKK
jgi:hypothetical protein